MKREEEIMQTCVNSGEMVLTRQQQARLFEVVNSGGTAATNYAAMAAAMATARSAARWHIPAPVIM